MAIPGETRLAPHIGRGADKTTVSTAYAQYQVEGALGPVQNVEHSETALVEGRDAHCVRDLFRRKMRGFRRKLTEENSWERISGQELISRFQDLVGICAFVATEIQRSHCDVVTSRWNRQCVACCATVVDIGRV